MNDETKGAVEVMRHASANGGNEVYSRILAHIDGEPARIAAAREEQRETCAAMLDAAIGRGKGWAVVVRNVPLDTTPLADSIAGLEARVSRAESALMELEAERAALAEAHPNCSMLDDAPSPCECARVWAEHAAARAEEREGEE